MLSNTAHISRIAPHAGAPPPHQLLLAEFIHRSANDFAVACAEVNIARHAATREAMRDRLGTVVDRLFALASIQRLLQAPSDAVMDLGSKLCELAQHHAHARFAEQGVFVRVSSIDISVDSLRGWALLMIVSELLTNAARHAFDAPGGVVDVVLARIGGEIRCAVSDDGVGMSPARASTGAGTAIVAALAREAGIQCGPIASPAGTRFELRMPAESPKSAREDLTGFYPT
ncbi:MAG: ATP-binding protein [Tsuneonella sp.]